MSIFSKIFGKREPEEKEPLSGGMEDFMTLIRVYYQAVMAADLGITNLAVLPDLRVFKTTLHVPTVNNKLGIGERNRCRKMLKEIYSMDDAFFKEIDVSIKKNCRKVQDIQGYLYMFSDFTQNLMMLIGNLMKLKLRMPSLFKKMIYTMTEKTINNILTKNDFKDASVMKACVAVRQSAARLNYSSKWITEFVYQVVMLAKKEPKPKDNE